MEGTTTTGKALGSGSSTTAKPKKGKKNHHKKDKGHTAKPSGIQVESKNETYQEKSQFQGSQNQSQSQSRKRREAENLNMTNPDVGTNFDSNRPAGFFCAQISQTISALGIKVESDGSGFNNVLGFLFQSVDNLITVVDKVLMQKFNPGLNSKPAFVVTMKP